MKPRLVADILTPLGDLPYRFRIFAAGEGTARWASGDTATFIMDDAAAEMVVSTFKSDGHDLVIDWEHQSEGGLFASPTGLAPAAGWITSLEWVPNDGLYADVSWTSSGADRLKLREYRFFSPVFALDSENNRIIELFSVALTNTPAILRSEPIAATRVRGDLIMTPEELIAAIKDALGLAAEATGDDLLAAIAEIQQALADAVTTEPAPADAPAEPAAPAEASATTPDPDKWVAASTFTARVSELQGRLDALQAAESDRARSAFIERGLEAGKIVAATRAIWETVFDNDAEHRDKRLEDAPVIASTTSVTGGATNTPKTTRASTIGEARAEYEEHAKHIACTRVQYVNQSLSEAGEPALTKDEAAAI